MKLSSVLFIEENEDGLQMLQRYFRDLKSRLFVVADENTFQFCFPFLKSSLNVQDVFVITPGEISKSIETCNKLWIQFLNAGITRQDHVIALGGGCVTDIAGFVCSVYKRGVPFTFIPTTLMGMTDAAHGGKNGVDLLGYKNMIGTFSQANAVIVRTAFLETLPERELNSGFAEIIKHALIADAAIWDRLPSTFDSKNDAAVLKESLKVKMEIVSEDFLEAGSRKLLNFGHTIGHAIESWYLENDMPLLHGEAIAAGICIESLLSIENGLSLKDAQTIIGRVRKSFSKNFPVVPPSAELMKYILSDKKNSPEAIRFTLLKAIGSAEFDISVTQERITAAIETFRSM